MKISFWANFRGPARLRVNGWGVKYPEGIGGRRAVFFGGNITIFDIIKSRSALDIEGLVTYKAISLIATLPLPGGLSLRADLRL